MVKIQIHGSWPDRRGGHLESFLAENLCAAKWSRFRAAVAFVTQSGVHKIASSLRNFSTSRSAQIVVGVDRLGTSYDGLKALLAAVDRYAHIFVYHANENPVFHPKAFVFDNDDEATIAIGSGNLTGGGLSANVECAAFMRIDLRDTADMRTYQGLDSFFREVLGSQGQCRRLDTRLLDELLSNGYVETEESLHRKGDRHGPGPNLFDSRTTTPLPGADPVDRFKVSVTAICNRNSDTVTVWTRRNFLVKHVPSAATVLELSISYGKLCRVDRHRDRYSLPVELKRRYDELCLLSIDDCVDEAVSLFESMVRSLRLS